MASQTFRVTADTTKAVATLATIKRGLTRTGTDKMFNKLAWMTRTSLVRKTPKRWTGRTRQEWRVFRRGASKYTVTNKSKVMVFLEKGTRAHGPVRAKRLFIPLTAKAARAGARGVMAANRQTDLNAAFGVKGARKKRIYVFGKDFVLAKKVKGIRARKIVANHRRFTEKLLSAAMRVHIRKLIAKA